MAQLPCDDEFLRRRPDQLSGGQRQRVALAAALCHRPDLLVLDEPTSALDPATAATLLTDIGLLRRSGGPAVLLVAHDLAQVASVADEVAVLDAGRVVEHGPVARVLIQPTSSAARLLVAAAHGTGAAPPSDPVVVGQPALVLRELVARRGDRSVLSGIGLSVEPGGCLSVVGPSGGGKTTLLRCLTGLHPDWSGELQLAGERVTTGLRGRSREQLRRLQLVPQDPHDSLNPRHTVAQIIARPLRLFRPGLDAVALRREVHRLLEQVELTSDQAALR